MFTEVHLGALKHDTANDNSDISRFSRLSSPAQSPVVSESLHIPKDHFRSPPGHMKFPSLIPSSNICWYASGQTLAIQVIFAHLHCFSYFKKWLVDTVSTFICYFEHKSPIHPCKSFENVTLCVWSKVSLQWFSYFCTVLSCSSLKDFSCVFPVLFSASLLLASRFNRLHDPSASKCRREGDGAIYARCRVISFVHCWI